MIRQKNNHAHVLTLLSVTGNLSFTVPLKRNGPCKLSRIDEYKGFLILIGHFLTKSVPKYGAVFEYNVLQKEQESRDRWYFFRFVGFNEGISGRLCMLSGLSSRQTVSGALGDLGSWFLLS